MQFAIVAGVVVLIVLAGVAASILVIARRGDAQGQRVHDAATQLVYQVPAGQDPGTVLAAVRAEGCDAVAEGARVVIACPGGAKLLRGRMRAVIAAAPLNFEGDPAPKSDIVFEDEHREL
jgi:hypothetical protein